MNDDYQTCLPIHDSQLDLTWWDEHYGIVFIFSIFYLILFVYLIGTQTNSRWPEYEEYRN
jgi:hypothetical protein